MTHSDPSGARLLAYPNSPEMTGRIDLSALPGSAQAGVTLSEQAEANTDDDTTIAFSLAASQAFLEERLSSAVDYRPSQEIARGGMGRIFAADDPTLKREVALKVSSVKDPQADSQFLREAQVLAQLAHPSIVPVHILGRESLGRPFYSMKLVKGRNLRAILRDLLAGDLETTTAFTRQRLMEVFRKVCDAVSFAHAKGFLHRDLKPENIMIGEYGEVLVMNWGLAKILPNHPSRRASPAGEVQEPDSLDYVEGTPQYMSPEQAVGMFGGLDERSDVYSLGGILFAILTLQPPVTGKSVEEVLQKLREGEIKTLTVEAGGISGEGPVSLPGRIPEALRAITLKALAKNREKRYASVNALGADIEAYQGGFATSAEEANLLRHSILFVRRHRIASALALLLLISGIGFTMRLAASEKRAVVSKKLAASNEKLAIESKERAVASAEIAEASAREAQLEKQVARQTAARTQIALAEAAEGAVDPEQMRVVLDAVPEDLRDATWRYLDTRVDTSDMVIKPPSGRLWRGLEDDPNSSECMFALQDDGVFCSVNTFTAEITPLWSVGAPLSEGSVLGVSDDGSVAVIGLRKPHNGTSAFDFDVRRVSDGMSVCEIRNSPAAIVIKVWVSDSVLLVSSTTLPRLNKLTAFDLQSGQMLWEKASSSQTGGYFGAGFGTDQKTVFVLTEKGEIQKLEARTGRVLGSGNKKIQRHASTFSEPWTAATEWKAFYICNVINPNNLRSFDAWTGELIFEISLLSGMNVAVGLVPKLDLLVCLSRRSNQGWAIEVFDKNEGTARGVFPGLGKISRFGTRLPVIRAKKDRIAVQLTDKMVICRLGFDEPSDTYKSLVEAHTGGILGDSEKIAFSHASGGKASVVIEDVGVTKNEVRKNEIIFSGEMIGRRPFVEVSQDGSKLATSVYDMFSACSWHEGDLHVLWSRRIAPKGPRQMSFSLHPREDLLWAGDFVVEFSSGKVLTEVNRTGLTSPEDFRFKVDWIGQDGVVEIVTLEGSIESFEGDLEKRSLRLWNTRTGEAVTTADAFHAVAVSTSPDGKFIAEAGDDKRLRLRNSQTLAIETDVRVHDKTVTSVAWHPTLPLIATTSEDARLRVWSLADFKLVQEYRLRFSGAEVRISPNGKKLYVVTGGKMSVFNPECFQQ